MGTEEKSDLSRAEASMTLVSPPEGERENQLKLAEHHLSATRELLKWRDSLIQLTHFGVGYALWQKAQDQPLIVAVGLVLVAFGMLAAFWSSSMRIVSDSDSALAYLRGELRSDRDRSADYPGRKDGLRSSVATTISLLCLFFGAVCAAAAVCLMPVQGG